DESEGVGDNRARLFVGEGCCRRLRSSTVNCWFLDRSSEMVVCCCCGCGCDCDCGLCCWDDVSSRSGLFLLPIDLRLPVLCSVAPLEFCCIYPVLFVTGSVQRRSVNLADSWIIQTMTRLRCALSNASKRMLLMG